MTVQGKRGLKFDIRTDGRASDSANHWIVLRHDLDRQNRLEAVEIEYRQHKWPSCLLDFERVVSKRHTTDPGISDFITCDVQSVQCATIDRSPPVLKIEGSDCPTILELDTSPAIDCWFGRVSCRGRSRSKTQKPTPLY